MRAQPQLWTRLAILRAGGLDGAEVTAHHHPEGQRIFESITYIIRFVQRQGEMGSFWGFRVPKPCEGSQSLETGGWRWRGFQQGMAILSEPPSRVRVFGRKTIGKRRRKQGNIHSLKARLSRIARRDLSR